MAIGVGRWRPLVAVLGVAALLLSCAPASDAPEQDSPPGFPVTIDNCGFTTTYERPPETVVANDRNLALTLVALDVDVAAASHQHTNGEPVPEQYREAFEAIPVVGDGDFIRKETLLGLNTTFLYAGFGYEMSSEFGTARQTLEELGIHTYLQELGCADESQPVTFDLFLRDLEQLGQIFGVQERAEELIAEFRQETDQARQAASTDTSRVLVYDSGVSAPFAVGGTGWGNALIEAAGGQNIFGDTDSHWIEGSWETVVNEKPTHIVLMDYAAADPEPGQSQLDLLRERLAGAPAIEQDRFLPMGLQYVMPGIESPEAVARLASFFGESE